ncbi:MAG TPA: response regulator [Candidatus Saccharimonadales bacterium]|nr:response regulator [Candidatus Saccharimonadales bacterium]
MEQEPKKILIIEDDQFIRDLYVHQLKKSGYNISSTPSGQEGLEALGKNNYDLLMLDLNIPDVSGFQILEHLQKNPKEGMPILILSNVAQDEFVNKGLEMGASAFIIKSNYTPDRVVAEVKSLIG